MFVLRFINVCCSSDGKKFAEIEDAYNEGRRVGFEFTVRRALDPNDESTRLSPCLLSWTVFGGRRNHRR